MRFPPAAAQQAQTIATTQHKRQKQYNKKGTTNTHTHTYTHTHRHTESTGKRELQSVMLVFVGTSSTTTTIAPCRQQVYRIYFHRQDWKVLLFMIVYMSHIIYVSVCLRQFSVVLFLFNFVSLISVAWNIHSILSDPILF